MREILFRGRTKDGKWHNGWYVKATKPMKTGSKQHEDWIVSGFSANGGWVITLARYAVDGDTVGQYTGLMDKNGVKIFEGDIIKSTETEEVAVVQWFEEHSAFMVYIPSQHAVDYIGEVEPEIIEVVGNIYDNPELLKEESE